MTEVMIGQEEARVINWRSEWLCAAGYSKINVELLATGKIDLWFACDALKHAKAHGYDEDYVMKLLL